MNKEKQKFVDSINFSIDGKYPIIGFITNEVDDNYNVRKHVGILFGHELDEEVYQNRESELYELFKSGKLIFIGGVTYTDFCIQLIMGAKEEKPENTTDNQKVVQLISWILVDAKVENRQKVLDEIQYRRPYCFGEKEMKDCNKYFEKGAAYVWIHISENAKPILPVFLSGSPFPDLEGSLFIRGPPSIMYLS
jgi:hypothetical protein